MLPADCLMVQAVSLLDLRDFKRADSVEVGTVGLIRSLGLGNHVGENCIKLYKIWLFKR